MAALKRVFRFDKKKRRMVEVTPKADQKICKALSREAQATRKRLAKRRTKHPASKLRNISGKWPIVSEAMAVNPEQVGEAREILKRAGVNTEYTKTGEPILRSAAHRKQHAQALGFFDRNGGYGDPQARNC